MLLEYTRKAIAKLTELKKYASCPTFHIYIVSLPILIMRKEEMRNVAGQVMADLERNKPASAEMVYSYISCGLFYLKYMQLWDGDNITIPFSQVY